MTFNRVLTLYLRELVGNVPDTPVSRHGKTCDDHSWLSKNLK